MSAPWAYFPSDRRRQGAEGRQTKALSCERLQPAVPVVSLSTMTKQGDDIKRIDPLKSSERRYCRLAALRTLPYADHRIISGNAMPGREWVIVLRGPNALPMQYSRSQRIGDSASMALLCADREREPVNMVHDAYISAPTSMILRTHKCTLAITALCLATTALGPRPAESAWTEAGDG